MTLHNDKETINILSVKHRLKPEVVEDIINHSLKCIKECMSMEEMPGILIHNLGRFKPSKSLLDRKFNSIIGYIEKDPNNYNKVNWSIVMNHIKVYDRLMKEEQEQESKAVSKIKEIINKRNERE